MHPIARNPRLAASSSGGIPMTAIRIGMMIGDEKGTSDNTLAVVPVGLSSTGWMNTAVLMIMIMSGLAACLASDSLFTDDTTAANSDEQKMNPNRKNMRKINPAPSEMSGSVKFIAGAPSLAMIGAR